jgi:trk system potassium uptake protein TrkA
MRVVFVGASTLALTTVKLLAASDHEIVVIEKDYQRIEALSDDFDCSFLHGDGSRPSVLKDVDPDSCDLLFCLSDDDNVNVLAAVVARSMGFKKVLLRIEDIELLPVCKQLELEHVIVPDRKVAEDLREFLEGETEAPETEE